jgi:transcriptional regulator with XRE-family HTH domain
MLRLRDSFATLCRDGRTRLDISQGQLARTADISVAYVSLIELGRANPTLAVVDRISDALGLELGLVPRPPVMIRGRQRDFVHARCSAHVQRRLVAAGLACEREVLIVDGRTRGWIDVMAFDRAPGTLIVIELKTAIDDLGAVERQITWYERNALAAARRFGWSVRRVRSWLLVLATDDVEATLRANREVLRTAFPGRARTMRLELAAGPAPGFGRDRRPTARSERSGRPPRDGTGGSLEPSARVADSVEDRRPTARRPVSRLCGRCCAPPPRLNVNLHLTGRLERARSHLAIDTQLSFYASCRARSCRGVKPGLTR